MTLRTVWVLLRVDTPALTYVDSVWESKADAERSFGARVSWVRGSGCVYGHLCRTGQHTWTLVPKRLRKGRG